MPRPDLRHNAAGKYRPDPRNQTLRNDHIVQLQVRRLIQRDGKLQGRRVFRPGYQSHLARRTLRRDRDAGGGDGGCQEIAAL
jgi:hypothetical protein